MMSASNMQGSHNKLLASNCCNKNIVKLEMWANAQRDGRPAKYRWRPLLKYCAEKVPRCETRRNLQRCPKLPDRSQPLVGRRSP